MNRFATYGILLAGATAMSLTACEKANPEKLGPGKDLLLTAVEQEKAESDNRFSFELFRTATANLGPNENAIEEGTEAAAVTSVGVVLTSTAPLQVYTFHADRPFLFAIREVATGLILFIGQVNDPSIEATRG